MPNMKSLSLMVRKLCPRLKVVFFFCHKVTDRKSHRQTGQKLNAPEFHSGGIEIQQSK